MGSPRYSSLPYLDSIAGFTILLSLSPPFASGFMTSSPRLSYFGVQIAVAFLPHPSQFISQSEAFALDSQRDRVVGILLGLYHDVAHLRSTMGIIPPSQT